MYNSSQLRAGSLPPVVETGSLKSVPEEENVADVGETENKCMIDKNV